MKDIVLVVKNIEHLANFLGTTIDRQFISCLEEHLIGNDISGIIVDEIVSMLLDRC